MSESRNRRSTALPKEPVPPVINSDLSENIFSNPQIKNDDKIEYRKHEINLGLTTYLIAHSYHDNLYLKRFRLVTKKIF